MTTVNQGVRKLDAMQLVTGQPVYTEDIAPENCLVVKLLRSPHANAMVRGIDTERAMRVPGMEAVFTWKDVPQNARRYTQAGQTAPEPSPLDRLVIDRHVRFAGDVVAILAGRDEACVDKAMTMPCSATAILSLTACTTRKPASRRRWKRSARSARSTLTAGCTS